MTTPFTNGDVSSVTVVVVTFNSEMLLPAFFAALTDAIGELEMVEVVVVDNGSDDGSVRITQELWPEATIVKMGRNAGYAAAINAAVAEARHSSGILVLNDDIRLGPSSIERMLETLAEPGIGIAVPRLRDGEGDLLKSLRREPTVLRALGEALLGGERAGRYSLFSEVIQESANYDEATTAPWASGCAWLISRECWDMVGRWDETFFLYAEDIDYALRARDHGFRLQLAPSAAAVHLVGPSHDIPRLWAMSVWNKYRVFRRRHGPVHSGAYRGALILNEGLRAMAGRSIHRAGLAALVRQESRPEEVR